MASDLVIARAGDASLHESWGPGSDWDFVVSYYGQNPARFPGCLPSPGGKLEALYNLWVEHPEILEGRRFVAVWDDDIAADPEVISKVFSVMAEYGLALAQPALGPGSFVNSNTTAARPGLLLRYTNYVEVMVPVFSSALLLELLPKFEGLRFGWALDHYWYRHAAAYGKVAVIDACVVTHTRKMGTGGLYKEGNPYQEQARTIASYGFLPPPEMTYGGITLQGTHLPSSAFQAGRLFNRRAF